MKLESCPRCGSKNTKAFCSNRAKAYCEDCGLQGKEFPTDNSPFAEYIDLEAAVAWWNEQVAIASLLSDNARLEAENKKMLEALRNLRRRMKSQRVNAETGRETAFGIMMSGLMKRWIEIVDPALSPSTDESEESDDR